MKSLITTQDPVFTWALHPYQLYEYGRDIGINSNVMLQNTGLDEVKIANLDLHINWMQYREMSLNFENFGPQDWCHQFGKRLSIASHGLFSLLALNCTSWRQVIDDTKQYSVLINPIFYVDLKETNEYIYITVSPEFSQDPVIEKHYEGYFTTLYQAIFQMGASDMDAIKEGVSIHLCNSPPAYSETLKSFFNNGVYWDHYCNQMRVKKELVDLEISNANPVYAAQTRKQLQAQLSQLPAQHGILRELRNIFSQQRYSLDECSETLYTSAPTLKRILKEAGTTFSSELTRYRVEQACWAANHTNLDINEVSEKLGFQDTNSFGRLFKKETSIPFNQYRNKQKNFS